MNTIPALRGYIGSRPYRGQRAPQHVQNLVVRDYCERTGHQYLLSATEYAMKDSHAILEDVIAEIPGISGIALYSIFMLPEDPALRADICTRVLESGGTLHGAVESLAIRSRADLRHLEDIWKVGTLAEGSEATLAMIAKHEGLRGGAE